MFNDRTVAALAALALGSAAAAPAHGATVAVAAVALTGLSVSFSGPPRSLSGRSTGQTLAILAPGYSPIDNVVTGSGPLAPADAPFAALGPGPFAPENSFTLAPFSGVRSDMLFIGTLGAAQAEARPVLPATVGFAGSNYLGQANATIAAGDLLSFSATIIIQTQVASTVTGGRALAEAKLQLVGFLPDGTTTLYALTSPCNLGPRLELSGVGFAETFCSGPVSFSTVLDQTGGFSLGLAFNAFAQVSNAPPGPVPALTAMALLGLGLGALALRRSRAA
jgi:hypothetical protein